MGKYQYTAERRIHWCEDGIYDYCWRMLGFEKSNKSQKQEL
jgi:hypothetical protein